MPFFNALDDPDHWRRLYEATLARGAELRGRVDRSDERPLDRLGEATVSVCVLAARGSGSNGAKTAATR